MTDVVSNAPGDVTGEAAARPHEHSRTGLSADALRRAIADHLVYSIARPPSVLTTEHYYRALALAVRDRMQQRWMATTQDLLHGPAKVTCYLSAEFLSTKPLFTEVVEEFLEFIGDAPLVIHNASFDISFINAELDRIKRPAISRDRLVDTLLLARRKHPGVSNRLDDLCSRYAIDNSRRTKHGALLDSELLAEVYIDLIGARQSQLILASETRTTQSNGIGETPRRQREIALAPRLTDADREAHRVFVATLGDKPIWNEFLAG